MLLAVLCHELAHIAHGTGHTPDFYAAWRQAMDEVELDLGRKMKIRRVGIGGEGAGEAVLRWMQWHSEGVEMRIRGMGIRPDEVAIHAAWAWECEHGWFRAKKKDVGVEKKWAVTEA